MCIDSYADISIHTPTRGTTSNSLSFSIFSVFQSTLPREERPLQHQLGLHRRIFQSTLPREERQILILFNRFECLFQSTLPREERPALLLRQTIYSPDFNPRSHERSDTFSRSISSLSVTFQSTLPREERQASFLFHFSLLSISIHAPTRGATIFFKCPKLCW